VNTVELLEQASLCLRAYLAFLIIKYLATVVWESGYKVWQAFFPDRRAQRLAKAIRKQWVEALHNRPWDVFDDVEVYHDRYNDEETVLMRNLWTR
jgi:hypothetical protein